MDNINETRLQQLEEFYNCFTQHSDNQDKHMIKILYDILNDENPYYRDMLFSILVRNTEHAKSLLVRIPQDGKHKLNVLNLLILISIYADQRYQHYLDAGYSIDKKNTYGTTLFDLIVTELEQPHPDLDNLVEGYLISSNSLIDDYNLTLED